MFALTPRLTLRPGWPEDAPALAAAIGHEAVVRNLARAPWPYGVEDAEAFLALPRAGDVPRFQIIERTGGAPRLIGGIGIDVDTPEGHEFGYWLTLDAWGQGYATEAGHAMVALARDSLRLPRLVSAHFTDNPASGNVLRKLGFRETGEGRRHSLARGGDVACITFALDLAAPLAIAA